jgi:hypothetical protein
MMALTDKVAGEIMGEIGVVTAQIDQQLVRMEQIAEGVRSAACEVNFGRDSLNRQNEAHLKNQFALLTDVVKSLKSCEEVLRESGPQDSKVLLAPLMDEMGKHVRTLTDKHGWAASLMSSALKVQTELAGKLIYATVIGILLFVGGGALGYLLGHGSR